METGRPISRISFKYRELVYHFFFEGTSYEVGLGRNFSDISVTANLPSIY